MSNVTILQHPFVQHKLSHMRDKSTKSHEFRTLLDEVSRLMVYEVTKNLSTELREVETPLCSTSVPFLSEKHPVLVSILRAGNGLLHGFMELMPRSKVGYIGLQREDKAKGIIEYYQKFPKNISERQVIVVDPMLASGKSSAVAIDRIKEHGVKNISFVCLLASSEGLEYLQGKHSDIQIYTASVDERLDERAYIIPGLGDAGDRIYGTY